MARGKNKQAGNKPRPIVLSGVEFTRRWALHILPRGFTKVRAYGGFSSRHRESYLECCRGLLKIAAQADPVEQDADEASPREAALPACPHCGSEMPCVISRERPSWRDIFHDPAASPWWYLAMARRPPST